MSSPDPFGPLHVHGEVLTRKPAGSYVVLTVVAPGVAERSRPGAFVSLGVGGEGSSLLARRAFWVHRARPTGVRGGTVDLVVEPVGPGTRWLARLEPGSPLDVVGPLGRPFALPREPATCALVAFGHGAAPIVELGERLRGRGCSVHVVLGAAGGPGLLAQREARRTAQSFTVATEDGSVGQHGSVTGALAALLRRIEVDVVYASGPLPLLAEVSALAAGVGAWTQVALETAMVCGTGLCSACVVPVLARNGVARLARTCVEGPVLAGHLIDWAAV